jgi:hypothetical protein
MTLETCCSQNNSIRSILCCSCLLHFFFFTIPILVLRLHLLFARTLFIQFELAKIDIRSVSAWSSLRWFPVLGSSFAASIYLLTMCRINFHRDADWHVKYLHRHLLQVLYNHVRRPRVTAPSVEHAKKLHEAYLYHC